MTNRERFRRLMRGEAVDRPPRWYGNPRKSTFDAWEKQGLSPEQRANWANFVSEDRRVTPGRVDMLPLPRFEERTLERKGNKHIWIDAMGAKRLDHVDPATPGFVTRSYLEFPVKTRDDFVRIKERYDPTDPRRQPGGEGAEDAPSESTGSADEREAAAQLERCNTTTEIVGLTARGIYWTLRDWVGFEGLSLMFYDQPKLVHEMMDFWTDFIVRSHEPVLSRAKVDFVILNEDMAYKTAAMISEPMMKEFMVPRYRRLIDFFKGHGVEFVVMDSDGYNGQILRAFMPEGLDGIQPMEIAANNDPAEYLAQYPRLVTWGGIDKRELRFDKARARAEVAKRFETQRRYGRYIPTVDHGVPPDIPLRVFLYMVELIQGFTVGEPLDSYEPPCVLERELGPIEEMFDPLTAVPREEDEDPH